MILSILKLLLQWSPTILSAIRKWDAEKHAREVVEEAERAVEREISQKGYDVGKAELVKLKAEDALLKKRQDRLEGFR